MLQLNAKLLESLKPPSTGRIELSDNIQRGLKFRLTANGVATWSMQVTVRGRKRRFTIGRYPDIPLSEARRRGGRMRVEALDGYDPIEEKRSAAACKEAIVTIQDALSRYEETHLLPNLRTAAERSRQLRRALKNHLHVPIGELSRSEIQSLIDAHAKLAPVAANRVRAALSSFVGWCWRRGHVDSNFALATTKATRERPRERVLSLSEIRTIYASTYQLGELWRPFVQLLLLTAQRRGDVAKMSWQDIDLDGSRWLIPGPKGKNWQPHIVHLSLPALNLLRARRPKGEHGGALVFTTTGTTPVSGFGKLKQRLDDLCQVPDWRLHDLRTAFATHMADLGHDEGVVDRVLNHVATASSASTVARIYNQAQRLTDRAKALDNWAGLIIP